MARGESGRIVIEVDPALKRELYAALAISGSTLKDWFVQSAEAYCTSPGQRSLFFDIRNADSQEASEPKGKGIVLQGDDHKKSSD